MTLSVTRSVRKLELVWMSADQGHEISHVCLVMWTEEKHLFVFHIYTVYLTKININASC